MRKLALAIAALLCFSGSAFAQLEGTLTSVGGGGGGGVSSVSGSAPITSTGGTTPAIGLTSPLAVQYGGRGCGSADTFASLPISPDEGAICPVKDSLNDCNNGNTVSGGGTHHCYVYWNNSSWQMIGTAAGTINLVNPMTTLGDIIYENATPAATRLAGSTSSSMAVLTQTGTGSISATPAWSTTLNTSLLSGTTTGVAFAFGNVSASQVVYYPVPIGVTFPTSYSTSNVFASCTTNPGEGDAYTLKSGGTSLATITVDTSCALTFSTLAASHVAAAGEKVEIDAPATVSGNISLSVQVKR